MFATTLESWRQSSNTPAFPSSTHSIMGSPMVPDGSFVNGSFGFRSPSTNSASPATSTPPVTSTPRQFRDDRSAGAFLLSLKEYFKTGVLSDVTIVCNGNEYKAHSVVLSANSKYFEKQLTGGWKESIERRIEITDFEPHVVEAMINWMYSFTFPDNPNATSNNMHTYVKVYQIGDKYQLTGLKESARRSLHSAFNLPFTVTPPKYVEAIKEIYSANFPDHRAVRDLVVQASARNLGKLLKCSEFQEMLRQTPDFSAELIPVMHSQVEPKQGDASFVTTFPRVII